MTEKEIHRFGEIQYLKGRLDELNKAIPTITNLNRQRKLDQRIEKYIDKLKKVDEVSYYLYSVEETNRMKSKERSKREIKSLLGILESEEGISEDIKFKIIEKINNY